ncbi:MAG: hypothetical protein WDM86_11415 [Rhizomicrobium sp.]
MRRPILFALALAVFAGRAAADDAAALRAAADGFYGVYKTFHPSDGIPDEAGRARYRPFLSARLDALLAQAGDADKRFAAANKAAPPLVEGDLFTSLFEGASTVAVGACTAAGSAGSCTASLSYAPPGGNPTRWTDTVYLVNTPEGWRVDDIGYGGSWDFGNKGRLSETLGQVIHFQ